MVKAGTHSHSYWRLHVLNPPPPRIGCCLGVMEVCLGARFTSPKTLLALQTTTSTAACRCTVSRAVLLLQEVTGRRACSSKRPRTLPFTHSTFGVHSVASPARSPRASVSVHAALGFTVPAGCNGGSCLSIEMLWSRVQRRLQHYLQRTLRKGSVLFNQSASSCCR